jgi:hypothetical protein
MSKIFISIFFLLAFYHIQSHEDAWEESPDENDVEDKDPEYVPDEIDINDHESELEIAAANLIKVNYDTPSENGKNYMASSGDFWSDTPDISKFTEFVFETPQLGESNADILEKTMFDTIFTENILKK